MTDNIWNIMGDEVSDKYPYDHNIPQSEKRRIQNRLNKRRSRKRLKLKLAAAASCEKPELNSHKHIILEPTNTYQLRGRNVVPNCGQPPLSQKQDRESTIVACGRSVDKARMESTSEDGITINYPSDAVRGSRRPDYPSRVHTEGQNDCLGAQSLHTTSDTQKSDINIVRPVLKAPQQRRTPSDEQESGQPMLTTTASDRTIDVARGALDHLLSISPEIQSEGDSQSLCCIPARPQLHTHIPGSSQDLNATLAQFRTHFQQAFEFVHAPLKKLQDRTRDLEQELYRRRNEVMRLGRYAAWMMIDIENILEAIEGIEVDTTVIETLLVEISKATQKRAEEKMRLHTRVKGLEKNLKALQNIVMNIASPC